MRRRRPIPPHTTCARCGRGMRSWRAGGPCGPCIREITADPEPGWTRTARLARDQQLAEIERERQSA